MTTKEWNMDHENCKSSIYCTTNDIQLSNLLGGEIQMNDVTFSVSDENQIRLSDLHLACLLNNFVGKRYKTKFHEFNVMS